MTKNVIILFLRKVMGALATLVATMLITRNLSVENYGLYNVFINTILIITSFLSLGIDSASGYVLQNQKHNQDKVILNIFYLTIFISIISFIVFNLIFKIVPYGSLNGIPPNLQSFATVIGIGILFTNVLYTILIGKMDFKNYAIFSIGPNVIFIILLSLFLIYREISLDHVIISYMTGFIITSILLIIYFFRNVKIFSIKDFKIDVDIQKYILKFGLKSYVSNLITILNYRINIFIIAHYLGSKETGIYSSCLVIIDFIWLLPATISSVTYPWFSNPSMSAQRKVMIPIITRVVIFLTFIATLLFYVLGDYLVNIVFGSKFTDTRPLFLYLGPGIILMAGSKIINVDFAAQGKPQINIYLNLMALIITVISNFLLIPRFHLIGAAVATSISFISWFSVSLLIYCKITKTGLREYLIPKINDLSFIINFKK